MDKWTGRDLLFQCTRGVWSGVHLGPKDVVPLPCSWRLPLARRFVVVVGTTAGVLPGRRHATPRDPLGVKYRTDSVIVQDSFRAGTVTQTRPGLTRQAGPGHSRGPACPH